MSWAVAEVGQIRYGYGDWRMNERITDGDYFMGNRRPMIIRSTGSDIIYPSPPKLTPAMGGKEEYFVYLLLDWMDVFDCLTPGLNDEGIKID